jgi:hypothetical protein
MLARGRPAAGLGRAVGTRRTGARGAGGRHHGSGAEILGCYCHAMSAGRSSGRSLALAVVAVFLTACGGSGSPSAASFAVASGPAPASAEESASALTPSSSASAASEATAVALGAVGVTPRGSRVTVHSFGPSERSSAPPAGSAWQEADLEWCLPSTLANPVTVGNIRYELNLELSDGTTVEPEAQADASDEVYALDGTFGADECVRGAMVFAVPTGATPEHLLLVGPKGGMRWRLS